MISHDLDGEELSNNLDENDNNLHIFEQFKEKNYENNESNRMQEKAIKDIFFKENNASFSTIPFQDTKKFLSKSFVFGATESDSKNLLNKKRKKEKIGNKNNNNNLKQNNSEKKEDTINSKENIRRGRRKKNVEYDNKPEHDKFKEDNIIQKIKTFTFDYILEQLNNSLKDEDNKFYPLTKKLYSNLKKDFNEKLLDRTIYDIYMNSELNKRYINVPDVNKTLIKKIYDEKNEFNTINILEKKFKDILDYIRQKDLDNFLNNFRLREIKKDNKSIDSYMNAVKKMLFNYEIYFEKKIVRSERKE